MEEARNTLREDEYRIKLQEAMQDPHVELNSEFLSRLDSESRRTLLRQRELDKKLSDVLSIVSGSIKGQPSSEESFNTRLLIKIKENGEMDAGFFRRLHIREFFENLRESWTGGQSSLRWASVAALVVIVAVPVIRVAYEQNKENSLLPNTELTLAESNTEPGAADKLDATVRPDFDETKRLSAPGAGLTPSVPSFSVPRDEKSASEGLSDGQAQIMRVEKNFGGEMEKSAPQSDEFRSETRERGVVSPPGEEPGLPAPSMSPEESRKREETRPLAPPVEEKILLQQYEKAHTRQEKQRALNNLLDFYKKAGRQDRVNEIQSRIKSL